MDCDAGRESFRIVRSSLSVSTFAGSLWGPIDKIMTFEHPPSTHGPGTTPKRTLGTPDSVENAQVRAGAPPGT
jgi:hypothetical protein